MGTFPILQNLVRKEKKEESPEVTGIEEIKDTPSPQRTYSMSGKGVIT